MLAFNPYWSVQMKCGCCLHCLGVTEEPAEERGNFLLQVRKELLETEKGSGILRAVREAMGGYCQASFLRQGTKIVAVMIKGPRSVEMGTEAAAAIIGRIDQALSLFKPLP